MRRALLAAAAAAVLTLPAPAIAQHAGATTGGMVDVSMGFAAFAPAHADVLVGDTVHWMNDSARAHTVTADDRSFDSGRVPAGDDFEHRYEQAGRFPYHCSLHPGMVGAIRAARVLMSTPSAPAAPERPYPVSGRAALGSGTPVSIIDSGNRVLGSATVEDDGTFRAAITPSQTTTLRATAGGETSAPVQLLVVDRKVTATVRGSRIRVHVTPPAPGQTVVLQLRLPLRFGWWPVHRARLDDSSSAVFNRPRRRYRGRVALTLRDRATVLATTSPFLTRPAS